MVLKTKTGGHQERNMKTGKIINPVDERIWSGRKRSHNSLPISELRTYSQRYLSD
jgi:hypothetical protein